MLLIRYIRPTIYEIYDSKQNIIKIQKMVVIVPSRTYLWKLLFIYLIYLTATTYITGRRRDFHKEVKYRPRALARTNWH
jgi:hypothetical protein